MEERVREVLAHVNDYKKPDGTLDATAIMTRFGIGRTTAFDIASIAERRLRQTPAADADSELL